MMNKFQGVSIIFQHIFSAQKEVQEQPGGLKIQGIYAILVLFSGMLLT